MKILSTPSAKAQSAVSNTTVCTSVFGSSAMKSQKLLRPNEESKLNHKSSVL